MSTNSIPAPTGLLIDPENPSETLAKCAGMARLLACIDYQQPIRADAERALSDLLNGMARAMEQAAESYTDRAWEVAA